MIDILLFNRNLQEVKNIQIDEVSASVGNPENLIWVDIEYAPDIYPSQEIKDLLQNVLKIHPLNIEDCTISGQNPKFEEFQDYSFSIVYAIKNLNGEEVKFDEIDIAIGKNYVLTYRHTLIEEVDTVKNTFKSKINHIHKNSSMLFHTVIDHIIDGYQSVVENLDIKIDKMGNKLFKAPNQPKIIIGLNSIKELLTEIRSIVVAEEGVFLNASKGFYSIVNEEENIFFKDIYDHLNKILDKIDKQSSTISNLFLIQMNLSTQKLNDLIKFLTIISAVLLPASVIAGIFGMNFHKMPPLEHPAGFYITIFSMFFVGLLMVIFFIKKKWI
ncbi:MAG: magnesium transporter CorA family protein [bacterium]